MAIDERLIELLAEAEELREKGCPVTTEALCPTSPELWQALQDLLEGLGQVDRLMHPAADSGSITAPVFGGGTSATAETIPAIPGYAILREIGRGGMGIVYEAHQVSLGRHVALKILLHHGDPVRFRREAKAAGRLHHTNIVPVFGVGEHQGRHYYAMQYIAGRGLDARSRRDSGAGPPDFRAAARIGAQVADALAYAHAHGVIHRDIKPSNLLIDEGGTVWITDFGLAKDLTDESTLTQTGDILGTLRYLAPERVGGRGDERVDIYGLGASLYELICGRSAFDQADRAALLSHLMHYDPPRPRQLDPRVPRDLETVILKAMARDPADRYASANGLAQDLRRFLEDRPICGRRVRTRERLVRWCRGNPATAAMAGGIVLALILGTAVASYFAIRATLGEELAHRNAAIASENARRVNREAQFVREEKRLSDRRLYVAEMHLAQQAWRDNRPDLVRRRLRQFVPERPESTDPRGFEWFYLERLCRVGPRTLLGHTDRVTSVAYSPDGRSLASAGADGLVILWDPATGLMVRTLRGHATKVEIDTLAFRPDGRTLASAGIDGTVQVWDTATGQKLLIQREHTDAVSGLAYQPDGRRFATGGHDATVRIWDVQTGGELMTLRGHSGPVYSLAYRADGQALVSASGDHTLKIWDAATGRLVRTLRGHSDVVRSLAYSPDGRTLASASWDQTIKLWDADTGRELRTLHGHTGPLTGVAFGPDGSRIASVAWDGSVRLWDAETGQELRTLRGHSRSEVNGVAYSPDGRHIASVGWDQTIKLWDLATTDHEDTTLRGHAATVSDLAYSPDGHILASSGWDRTVKLWDTVTGLELRALRGHVGGIQGVAFSPDGGRLASAGNDAIIRLWDAATGQPIRTLAGHAATIRSVAFSPDGRWLVSGSLDRTVRVWDIATGRPVRTLRGHTAGIRRVAVSPDGILIASAGLDGAVKLWDAITGREVRTFRGHAGSEAWGVAFSPDGRTIASAGADQTVQLWEAASGREIHTLLGHAAEVDGVVFSPDGRRLVSVGEDRTVKLWDPATGQEVVDLRGHTDQVLNAAFSPDGLTLVSASGDGTVMLWDATPLTPELQVLREARGVVEFFFARSLPTAEVLDRIRSDAALTPEVRRRALELAGPYGHSLVVREAERRVESLYARPMFRREVLEDLRRDASLSEPVRHEALVLAEQTAENPMALHRAAWAVVRRSDADADAYRLALRQAEAACRLIPTDDHFLEALGAAQYRVGQHRDAVDVLTRAGHLSTAAAGEPTPAELTFLALSQHHLGRPDQARATLDRLQELSKRAQWTVYEQEQGFLREAETLKLDLAFPADPFAP